jgi:hypothetical protein
VPRPLPSDTRRRAARASAALGIGFSLAACGGAPPVPLPAIDTSAGECFQALVPGYEAATPSGVDLTGTWLALEVRHSVSDPPMIGEVNSTTYQLARLEIAQQGALFEVTGEVCDMWTESDNDSAQTTIPDAWVASMPPIERSGVLVGGEGPDDYMVFFPGQTQVRGVALDDEEADPLPDDEDDPRLLDPDGDGNPGLTLHVEGMVSGDLYLVQRVRSALCGAGSDPDHFAGTVEWNLEQSVVDASSFMLNRQTETRPHPDASRHTFEARRIEPGTTCDALRERRDELVTQD